MVNLFFRRGNTDANNDLSLPPISLLAPTPQPLAEVPPTQWASDLGLDDVMSALTLDRRYRRTVRNILVSLTSDAQQITWRQTVLQDLLSNPTLLERLEALLPKLGGLSEDSVLLGRQTRSMLLETADRLSELDLYTELIEQLAHALEGATLSASAFQQLQRALLAVLEAPAYQRLRAMLPQLREPLRSIGSITVGINLDVNLKPLSAVLMAIHSREVGEPPSLLNRLFGVGENPANANTLRGVAPVHYFPQDDKTRRFEELFQDVDKLLEQTAKPIAQELRAYVNTSSHTLVQLEGELAFFIGAARLIQRLQARGVPFCAPSIAPAHTRETRIDGLYNLALLIAQDARAVPSDVRFDDAGRVAVLTGPNSGGKTTYLRNVGLAQVIFQAGLFIPATQAHMSTVDQILTHFPRLETREQGRLAEEAERLRQLFSRATPQSLVLLNETFSSTALSEALYLAQDILCGLCVIGVRAVFATHIIELVSQFESMEQGIDARSRLYSLVAGIRLTAEGVAQPTYQIQRGEPLGRSYAHEIARRHGISLTQILDAYAQRNAPPS